MKIVFRISRLGSGGAERVFLSVAEYLQREARFDVCFVVDRDEGENVNTARQSGFIVHSLGVTRTFKSIPAFKALLERERPDIVISAYPDTNAAALISSRLSRHDCPIIVTEHASIKDHFACNPWYRRLMVRVFISYVYRLAAHVICVSKGLEQQVVSFLRKKELVSTIYNPVRFVDNGIRSNRSVCTRLLAVGRFSVQKDYLTLLKAVNIVRQHSPIHLQIVGGVQEAQEVQRLNEFISENNMQKCVELVAYTDDIAAYYRQADIFILSSAWEGFGNVIVEALAFGLPVVSTNCDFGPSEILCDGQFGELVPVGDAQAMAIAIVNIINTNPFVMEQQRERALDFSEYNIGRQYQGLITKITGDKRTT